MNFGFGLGLPSSPLGTGGGSAPPTPANFIVHNDAEFAAANTAATAGQIIELADGSTFGSLTLTNATGVTVRGASPFGHTISYLTLNGCQGATVQYLNIQATDTPTGKPKLVTLNGVLTGLVFEWSKVRGGNPWNGFANFDVTVTDEARMGSSGSGWGSTNPYSQDLWTGIGQGVSIPDGSIIARNNDVSDCGEGIKFAWKGNGGIEVTGNRVGRCYQDLISIGIPDYGGPITKFWVLGNELYDGFAQPQDNLNPHGDAFQFFTDDYDDPGIAGNDTYRYPINDFRFIGNIMWVTPGCRGQTQRFFVSDFMDGYPFIAPTVYGNILISRITNKGMSLSAGDNGPPGTGAVWGNICNNVLLANPTQNTPIQNELTANTTSGIPAASGAALSTVDVWTDPTYNASNPPLNFIRNLLVEYINPKPSIRGASIQTGRGSTATSYQTWFDARGGLTWQNAFDQMDSAEKTFQQFAASLKSGFSAYSPIPAGETVTSAAGFMSLWSDPTKRPWSKIPPCIGWGDLEGQALNTVISSGWCFAHAGFGSLPFHGSGGEYRTATDHLGTGASSWAALPASGSPINLAHGTYVEIRRTSSASEATSVTVSVTLGSYSTTWSVTTLSTAVFPVVAFVGTDPDRFAMASGALDTADSAYGTCAVLAFKKASAPASNGYIYRSITTSAGVIELMIVTTGVLRVVLRNSAGTVLLTGNSSISICDNVQHDILVSWDVSQASGVLGFDIYIDGVARTGVITGYVGGDGVTVGWSKASQNMCFGGVVTGTSAANLTADVGAFWLETQQRVDLSVGSNRAQFSAGLIGSNGNGITGAQPRVFLVGNAAQWNAGGGINWGSGAKYVAISPAAVTDVSGSAWV